MDREISQPQIPSDQYDSSSRPSADFTRSFSFLHHTGQNPKLGAKGSRALVTSAPGPHSPLKPNPRSIKDARQDLTWSLAQRPTAWPIGLHLFQGCLRLWFSTETSTALQRGLLVFDQNGPGRRSHGRVDPFAVVIPLSRCLLVRTSFAPLTLCPIFRFAQEKATSSRH